MRIRILPSAPGDSPAHQHLMSYLVEDTVAIDAGCLGLQGSTAEHPGLEHVFLTHAHLDHVSTLPLFLEDRHDQGNGPVHLYGPPEALDTVRQHFFNDQVWVDSAHLLKSARPWVEMRPVEPEQVKPDQDE